MDKVSENWDRVQIPIPPGVYGGLDTYFPEAQPGGDSSYHLEIARTWIESLAQFRGFGPYFLLSTSGSMTTGKFYNDLLFHADDELIGEIDGCLLINPLCVSSMVVCEERAISGDCIISVQLFDATYRGFVKICLSSRSNLEAFAAWLSQAMEREKASTKPEGMASFLEAQCDGRERRKQQGHCRKVCDGACQPFPKQKFQDLLDLAQRLNIPLEFQGFSPTCWRGNTVDSFHQTNGRKIIYLESNDTKVSFDETKIKRLHLGKPANCPDHPYALNIHECCDSCRTVVVPALAFPDKLLTEWNAGIESLIDEG